LVKPKQQQQHNKQGFGFGDFEFRCCTHGTAVSIFFSNRVINRWNQLDQRVVDASSISAFKGWLNKISETRMGFFMDWSAEP